MLSELIHVNSQVDGLTLQEVAVFGVPKPPQKVLVNGVSSSDFSYRLDTKVLTVEKLSLPMGRQFVITWA